VFDLDDQFLDHFEIHDPDRQPGSDLIKIFSLREKDAAQCFHFAAPSTAIARRWLATVNPAPTPNLADLQAENDRLQRELLALENSRPRREVEIRLTGAATTVVDPVQAARPQQGLTPAVFNLNSVPLTLTEGLEVSDLDGSDDHDLRNRGLVRRPEGMKRRLIFIALTLEASALFFTPFGLKGFVLLMLSWFSLPMLIGLAVAQTWSVVVGRATLSRRDRDGAVAAIVFLAVAAVLWVLQYSLFGRFLSRNWVSLAYGAFTLVGMLAHLWHAVQVLRSGAPYRVPEFEHIDGAPAHVLLPPRQLKWLRLSAKATTPLTLVAAFALAGAYQGMAKDGHVTVVAVLIVDDVVPRCGPCDLCGTFGCVGRPLQRYRRQRSHIFSHCCSLPATRASDHRPVRFRRRWCRHSVRLRYLRCHRHMCRCMDYVRRC
jgi:hypothetical protein